MLDYGKNDSFINHSALFMSGDIEQADYHYAYGLIEHKPAFVRSLHSVVRRLDMLGYTLQDCERLYGDAVAETLSNDQPPLTFERFAEVIRGVDVGTIRISSGDEGDDPGGITKLLGSSDFECLDRYVVLRLLAENPKNMDHKVIWEFADVVDGGWVDKNDLYQGVSQRDRCLIVTEGSSDGKILQKALSIVAPDVADFFDFVDMSEGYPFTGTGNLFRFCQGLASIKIQNRILIVLDNDTAGQVAFRQISKLNLPPRMRITMLPALEECRNVRTLGPSGTQYEDINGRAVSIEWFLDTLIPEHPYPTIRWTSYNNELDAYQGELVDKKAYVRHFFDTVKRGSLYKLPKLEQLWDHMLATCTNAVR